eukprot:s121_g4.t2
MQRAPVEDLQEPPLLPLELKWPGVRPVVWSTRQSSGQYEHSLFFRASTSGLVAPHSGESSFLLRPVGVPEIAQTRAFWEAFLLSLHARGAGTESQYLERGRHFSACVLVFLLLLQGALSLTCCKNVDPSNSCLTMAEGCKSINE